MNYSDHGFVRVAAVAPELVLADPQANAAHIVAHLAELAEQSVTLALFPELSLTGYSCEDLFLSSDLQRHTGAALASIATHCHKIVAVVGAPWRLHDGRLLNCAVVLADGRIAGVVPKSTPPNYGEFYERRWFMPGDEVNVSVDGPDGFLISPRQIFEVAGTSFGIEICEDLWAPRPPGIEHALAGAELILNPSASNELVAKADYRRDLVHMASARGICGYLYAGSGVLESTKDVVFGGHLLAAENGVPVAESDRFSLQAQSLITEFDIERLRHDRMQNTTFGNTRRNPGYQRVPLATTRTQLTRLRREIDAAPFVPRDEVQFNARAAEILEIQATGLARRHLAARTETLVIGVSGGLDSTLAFLVCLDAVAKLGLPPERIHALTLPGPGTSDHTLASARQLCAAAGVPIIEIPIGPAVTQHLKDLQHDDERDVVFENAQARERTQICFNYANKASGIVVGTGDLSELALGWCTFNADQMANYNVNAGVPKTLVGYLVRWYARHRADARLAAVLERVLDTPISPELIAPQAGEISQHTESIIGPYELHDFFLFHTVRNGSGVAKVFALAQLAFAGRYAADEIGRWLRVFLQRFYSQQFKRTTLPPGPKVGTVSLSPRGDWRMPDEASVSHLLAELDGLLDTGASD
jgi:NAD+ synthase (glutamine-hydrolysing)